MPYVGPTMQVGNLIVGKEDSLFGLDSDPGRRISRDTVRALHSLFNMQHELARQQSCLGQALRVLLVGEKGSTLSRNIREIFYLECCSSCIAIPCYTLHLNPLSLLVKELVIAETVHLFFI